MTNRKNIPEEILDDDVADFIGAASAAKAAGKKKFKFGDKEYPVTISDKIAKTVNKEAVVGIMQNKDDEKVSKGSQKMGSAKNESLDGRTKAFKEKLQKLSYSEKKKDKLENEKNFDGRGKEFKEKLVKLGYKKPTMEERLLEKMGKSSTGYDLYHKDFSSAMKHAYEFAKKKYGIDIDPKEIDDKVATGPRKPTSGKTNSYRLLDKDGKKAVQIQVYNMDNKKYELNMYKEEKEFEPHMMYDPKTGKGYKAEKPEDHERMSKMGYTHEKPKMEEFHLHEASIQMVARDLESYAKKDKKGIDYDDFMKAAKMMKDNQLKALISFVNDLDTEPREKILMTVKNVLGKKTAEKMFGVRFFDSKINEIKEMKQPFVVVDTADGNKVVGMASDEKGAKSIISTSQLPPMKIKDKKTLKIVKTSKKQDIGFPVKEDQEVDEVSQDTLRNYHGKAGAQLNKLRDKNAKGKLTFADLKKGQNRAKGLNRAANKMEEIELKEFETEIDLQEKLSPAQIKKLKSEFEDLRGKKISAQSGMKLSKALDKLDKEQTIALVNLDLPFVSTLAVSKLMMNFNMSPSEVNKIIDGKDESFDPKLKEELKIKELIESSDKKDAEEMKEIVLAMNPKYNTKQVQKEVEKMAMEKYGNSSRAKKIASYVK